MVGRAQRPCRLKPLFGIDGAAPVDVNLLQRAIWSMESLKPGWPMFAGMAGLSAIPCPLPPPLTEEEEQVLDAALERFILSGELRAVLLARGNDKVRMEGASVDRLISPLMG